MGTKKIGIIIGAVLLIVVLLMSAGNMIEVLEGGEVHMKQALMSGDLTVITDEGPYLQAFGKITSYDRNSKTHLSNDELDGGKGAETSAINVRFGDGGTADIGSVTEWRIPLGEVDLTKIHRNYKGKDALSSQVRQWVIEVEKQTASTFKADETYSTGRSEFIQLITDQIRDGLYATTTEDIDVPTNEKDDEGNVIMAKETRTIILRDPETNTPVISKPGLFKEYKLELVNHSIKAIDYDETIDQAIANKKTKEQEKAIAKLDAEKAVQDTLTAKAEGEAAIAKAKAKEEVAKITAVTQAEKNKAVAELKAAEKLSVAEFNKKATAEDASAMLIKERAEADANLLKVKAGLTPQQKAEWAYKTSVDTAKAWAEGVKGADYPDTVVMGGGSGEGGTDFAEMLGLETLMRIQDRATQQ